MNVSGSSAFFTNGAADPWLPASVTGTLAGDASGALVIRCEGCGHCVDLKPPAASDAPELAHARRAVAEAIGQWLQAPAIEGGGGGGSALAPDNWFGVTAMADPSLLSTMTSAMTSAGMLETQQLPGVSYVT